MPVVVILLLLLGGYEAILGFRQLYGFSVSNHSLYALTGSFYNPGPYMGYLAMVLPVCVYVFCSCHSDNCKEEESVCVYRSFASLRMTRGKGMTRIMGMTRYMAGAVGLMILCLLPSGMSRLPGRIYPYYLLAKLYEEVDCFPPEKLEWAVKKVLETEPKVHSRAIDEMREEVKGMLSQ